MATPQHPAIAALRSMHPADREKALKSLVQQPIQQAQKDVKKSLSSTANEVNELQAKVADLTKQLAATARTLEVRKRTSPQELRDALNSLFESYNFSPAEELVQMLMEPSHPHYVEDVKLRASILMELQSYVMPKLKSTEITGKVKHEHSITILRIGEDGTQKRESLPVREVEVVNRVIEGGPANG